MGASQDVIQVHLDRIKVVNPTENAVTVVLKENALRASSKADKKIAAGVDVGPLHGVPIAVKEVKGLLYCQTSYDQLHRFRNTNGIR